MLLVIDKNFTSWRLYARDFKVGKIETANVKCLMTLRTMSEGALINRENFRQIYSLAIRNTGKQNVINTIRTLEKLPFVLSAEPNYTENFDNVTQSDK